MGSSSEQSVSLLYAAVDVVLLVWFQLLLQGAVGGNRQGVSAWPRTSRSSGREGID